MYLVSEKDFNKQYSKPKTGIEMYTDKNLDTLDMWINDLSPLLLQETLGNVLFADFDSNVTDGVLDTDAPQKWLNLVHGVTYEYNDNTCTWRGLLQKQETRTKSLLVDYIFAEWYGYRLSHLSNFGETQGKAINSIMVSGNANQYKAWNSFVRAYQGKHKYTENYFQYWNRYYDRGLYDNFLYGNYNNNETGYVCMVDFIKQNKEDYPDPALKLYGLKNAFSI